MSAGACVYACARIRRASRAHAHGSDCETWLHASWKVLVDNLKKFTPADGGRQHPLADKSCVCWLVSGPCSASCIEKKRVTTRFFGKDRRCSGGVPRAAPFGVSMEKRAPRVHRMTSERSRTDACVEGSVCSCSRKPLTDAHEEVDKVLLARTPS